jgi:hypothetical protein
LVVKMRFVRIIGRYSEVNISGQYYKSVTVSKLELLWKAATDTRIITQMKISRRSALKSTSAGLAVLASGPTISTIFAQLGATPAPFARMRLEDFIKNPQRVSSLKRGVEVMKGKMPSDPRSWFFQAAIHGVSNPLLADALKRDPDVAKVDQDRFWNRCPHYDRLKAPSADFLIWHRAYVYHFERILRAASGDPQLSLPYWNYLEDGQRTFPLLYADPDRAKNPDPSKPDGPAQNSLYDGRREGAFTLIRPNGVGLFELNSRTVNADSAFAENRFFGAIGSDGFAGSASYLEPANSGLIERNPHNPLHLAIGGLIGVVANPDPNNDDNWNMGLMANVPTAAFDPVFWAHHCNIDRLWSAWESMPGRTWGNAPQPTWFEEKPWWFYDDQGDAQNSPRSFYISQKALGIVFDTDKPGAARLSDQLPSQSNLMVFNLVGASGAMGVNGEDKSVALMGTLSKAVTLTPDKPAMTVIQVTGRRPFGVSRLHDALTKPPLGVERRALLILQGISYMGVPSVSYEVYANLGRNEKPNPRGKSFIGVIALFGIQHEGHAHEGGNQQIFDITKQISPRLDAGSSFNITFFPEPLLVAQAGAIMQPRRTRRPEMVTISGITLSGVEALGVNR